MKKHFKPFSFLTALILLIVLVLVPTGTFAGASFVKGVFASSTDGNALWEGEGTEQSPYLIQSAEDWDALSEYTNGGGTDYAGKYFLLTEDISVSTMVGFRDQSSADIPFTGTFDGGGHTLNVSIRYSGAMAAPFGSVCNAVIKNLNVTGTVNGGIHSSGLVGGGNKGAVPGNTLEICNVRSSVAVNGYNNSAVSHLGGIVGHSLSARITMDNVVFAGSLNGSTAQGGFVGWGGGAGDYLSICVFSNCLFAGTVKSGNTFHPVGYAYGNNGRATLTNFYTTKDKNNTSNAFDYQGTSYTVLSGLAAKVTDGGAIRYYDNFASAASAQNWKQGSTLTLLGDVSISSTLNVPAGEYTLDLNGYGIRRTGSGCVIRVNEQSTLNLKDSNPSVEHRYSVSNPAANGAGVATVNDALTSGYQTFTGGYVTGGYITGGYNYGAGINVEGNGAALNMYGGTIIGNRLTAGSTGGGGVCLQDWTGTGGFHMYGGSIIGNTSNYGGGVYVRCGTMVMVDGEISRNVANNNIGGGLLAFGTSSAFIMEGGVINGNYAQHGGAIEASGEAAVSISGGVITNNTASGKGGALTNQRTDGDTSPAVFNISGAPVFSGNTAGGQSSDVYLCNTAVLNVTGELTNTTPFLVKRSSGTGAFTSGWNDKMGDADPSDCFKSENGSYQVFLNPNGEAEIGVPPAARVITGESSVSYNSFSDALNSWTAGSTLKLLADVTTSGTINVPSGEHTLDLNGHSIKAGSTGYSVVTVGSDADLTILDGSDEGAGRITGGSVGQNYGGGVTVDGGTLTLRGGAISGNANTYGGIGNCGGGVHVRNSGKFYMEGGEISGNTSYVGGGVCTDTSATTVSITGGIIKNNKTERFGSAVWAGRNSAAVFRIGGDVRIVNNISTWTGDKDGEGTINFVSALSLSGNPVIRGEWKTNGTSSRNTHINLDNDGSSVQRIELDGVLTNDTGTPAITLSPIYRWSELANGQTFVFTKNWSTYMGTADPADYFRVDSSATGLRVIRKDGEAALASGSALGDFYVFFYANNGEGGMDPQLATAASAVLNENAFTREGYVFAGWNTKADGSGTGYTNKAAVTLTGDLTLYAQWKEPAAVIVSGGSMTEYVSLSDALNAWTAGSTLKLLADVTTSGTLTAPSGAHTLDLNGHTITRTGATGADNSGLVITVNDGVNLTVTGPGKITGGSGFHGGGIHVEGNSSLVLDNCEISGNTGHYGGGLYLKNGTITLKNGTVVKENSATEGFGGSGIYAEGGGTLILEDSKFINNEIKNNNQYAVFLAGNANVKVSGAPVINDNTYGGKQKDLYLYQAGDQRSNVQIIGELTDGAKIIVGQTTGTGVIGSDWKANMGDVDPADYLVSADTDYVVFVNKDDELEIGYPEIMGVSAEGFEGDYDGEAHGITVSAPDGAVIKYGTTSGSYTLSNNPTYTDAGTYTVYYMISLESYKPVYGSADVKINPIDVTVTVTGHTGTVDYDGTEHTVTGYDAVASTDLYDVTKDFTFSGEATAAQTNAGSIAMGLAAEQFVSINANFAAVNFVVTDGSLTVLTVDAAITAAPRTGSPIYNGSELPLLIAGTAKGGTFSYALGADAENAPDAASYQTAIPTAKDLGRYFVWYRVDADHNHNGLPPVCLQVVLAEEGWKTLNGTLYQSDGVTPVAGAAVTLTQGDRTVDAARTDAAGGYQFIVPAGVYNVVASNGASTETTLVKIYEDQDRTLTFSAGSAIAELKVNADGDKHFGVTVDGLTDEALSVREAEAADKTVSVLMTVEAKTEETAQNAALINELAGESQNLIFFDTKVEKTVDSVTTVLQTTSNVLELAVPYDKTGKRGVTVYASDGSGVQTLRESDGGEEGTFRIDKENGLIYVYSNRFSTFAIGYTPYYRVESTASLGSFAGTANVVIRSADGSQVFELQNVAPDRISFDDIPKGKYTMTITWEDGAENTLTVPLTIRGKAAASADTANAGAAALAAAKENGALLATLRAADADRRSGILTLAAVLTADRADRPDAGAAGSGVSAFSVSPFGTLVGPIPQADPGAALLRLQKLKRVAMRI